jgi:hypothetical protein
MTGPTRHSTDQPLPQPTFLHTQDPKRSLKIDAADVGLLIAKRPFGLTPNEVRF